MPVLLATTREDLLRAHEVLRALRPKLVNVDEMVAAIEQQQREGYQVALLEHEGEIVTYAGFRIHHVLFSGLTLYVDDLVTGDAFRSQGHGKTMLDWLHAHARERGCRTLSLDSGTFRPEAHAFYFREGMRISCYHFEMPVKR